MRFSLYSKQKLFVLVLIAELNRFLTDFDISLKFPLIPNLIETKLIKCINRRKKCNYRFWLLYNYLIVVIIINIFLNYYDKIM